MLALFELIYRNSAIEARSELLMKLRTGFVFCFPEEHVSFFSISTSAEEGLCLPFIDHLCCFYSSREVFNRCQRRSSPWAGSTGAPSVASTYLQYVFACVCVCTSVCG